MNKKYIIITAIILFTVFGGYVCISAYYYPELLSEARFQDFFAGITALFSGLAFLGVVSAILLQKEELSLQREELKQTREELKRSAKAQEKSEQALSKQAESLKITAKLNGLSALLQRAMVLRDVGIAKYGRGGVDIDWEEKAESIAIQIENEISGK